MAGIKDIATGAGVKKEHVVDVFEEIFRRLKKGETVKVVGFGSFQKRTFPAGTVASSVINDGKPVEFKKSYRIAFKQTMAAKKRLNRRRKKKDEPEKTKGKKPTKSKKKKAANK